MGLVFNPLGPPFDFTGSGGSGSGDVTHTGPLTAGQLIQGNGGADITVGDLSGDVSTSGSTVTTIGATKVTLAKIQNATANSKLLGSGAAGSGASYVELSLGTNLSMSGTTLNASASGTGDVVGPGSATDNAITRFDGTTGKLIQNSGITIADGASGALSGTNTGDQNLFASVPVGGQTTVTASTPTTALTFVASTGMTITTDNTAKSVTFASSGGTATVQNPLLTTGRLTLITGNAIPTTDQTGKGTLYYTSIANDGTVTSNNLQIALWNGSAFAIADIAQLSLALTLTSGKNYDVFIDYNSGTPQVVLSAAWTNDTTRADALAAQSGIVVKSGTPAYRWVGTIRASGSNVTEDSFAKRFVWNAYNAVERGFYKTDATGHTYNGGYRQWNNDAANQIALVCGAPLSLTVALTGEATTPAGGYAINAFGLDSTSAFYRGGFAYAQGTALTLNASAGVGSSVEIPLGYHFVAALEGSASSGTATFGDFFLTARGSL